MDQQLVAMFTDEERQAAAAIGESSDLTIEEKVTELFRTLEDPLLSADDIDGLLGSTVSATDVANALLDLTSAGTLEHTVQTQRPFDPQGVQLFRLADVPPQRLELVGIESALRDGTSRFQFTCDGRLLRSVARIDRLDAISGEGQQRAEIKKHVQDIADGITGGTQVPNSVLLVFLEELTRTDPDEEDDELGGLFVYIRPRSDWVEVPSLSGGPPVQRFRFIEIDIPYRHAAFDGEKPALLVDGQQRTAALSLVSVDDVPAFDLSVNAVIADESDAKRVFQIANSTVKIATDFSLALLASMDEAPGYLKSEKIRAGAVRQLALSNDSSPFYHIVRYPGAKISGSTPVVAYNSLYHIAGIFESSALPIEDSVLLSDLIARGFNVVKDVWPDAWGKRPTDSKLMHGAGLRAMASLLTLKLEVAHSNGLDLKSDAVWSDIRSSIERLATIVPWTESAAAASGSKTAKDNWTKEIRDRQNTSQDISRLTTFLKRESVKLDEAAREQV